MKLEPRVVREFLETRKVKQLYHANTVATATSFLRVGKLLSRCQVEAHGLSQTAQRSDEIDKKFGVWDLIFGDSVDIHQRAKMRNFYGPVLFEIDLNILDDEDTEWVGVTKKNPTKWEVDEEPLLRWFGDLKDLKENYVKGQFDHMIVIYSRSGIKLQQRLSRIVLDDPGVVALGRVDLYSLSLGALSLARSVGELPDVGIHRRECHETCQCLKFYRNTHLRNSVLRLFDPREAHE